MDTKILVVVQRGPIFEVNNEEEAEHAERAA